ncbi:MAG TPA: hypothetical protein VFA09_10440 [Ktedonobacteraceae bacterium]|nr:hypothetical protein [Ktedonobacteraceae bacterium]
MSNVITGATLSLDGFMADRHGDIRRPSSLVRVCAFSSRPSMNR